jgi:acid stress chaperone HdeB
MTKPMLIASGLMLILVAVRAAQAQVTVDISKITCDQYVGYKITEPRNIAIWLSGYYNGKRGNTVIDTQDLAKYARKVQDYCLANPQVPVMQAVEKLLGTGK